MMSSLAASSATTARSVTGQPCRPPLSGPEPPTSNHRNASAAPRRNAASSTHPSPTSDRPSCGRHNSSHCARNSSGSRNRAGQLTARSRPNGHVPKFRS
jgi:hypothetical protein